MKNQAPPSTTYHLALTALLIFALALTVRAVGLGQFLTADEPRWIEWSSWFTSGLIAADFTCPPVDNGRPFDGQGWQCTLNDSIPGVTTMWLTSFGLLYEYALNTDSDSLLTFLTTFAEVDPTHLPTLQFPFAFVSAVCVTLFYLLLCQLWPDDKRVALIAALLLSLQPFHIALSRVIHHDALTANLLMLSVLLMCGYWLQQRSWIWLIASAILAGLAILSKPLGWFAFPFAAVIGWLGLIYDLRIATHPLLPRVFRLIRQGILWGLIALLTCVLCFPAMLTDPLTTTQVVLGSSTLNTLDGHLQYFLGTVSENPGWRFYPVGWFLRSTPLEIFGLLCVVGLMFGATARRTYLGQPLTVGLLLYIALFLIFVTLSPKKQLRFLLPIFPAISILAAMGMVAVWDLRFTKPIVNRQSKIVNILILSLLIITQMIPIWQHAPYYFTYYNPLAGGASQAQRLITVGWGEGQAEAAAYLNRQPHAESLRVAVIGAAATFRPFSVSDDIGGSSSEKALSADVISYYVNLYQRLDARPEYQPVWHYLQTHYQPEQRIRYHGVDYVLLYRNPIEQRTFWQNENVTVFGYTPSERLTLIWQHAHPSENNPQSHTGDTELKVGLAAPISQTIAWSDCARKPTFAPTETILESDCPISAKQGIYQLWLQTSGGSHPYHDEFVQVEGAQISPLDATIALDHFAADLRPASATPLDLPLNDQLRLIGYDITVRQAHSADGEPRRTADGEPRRTELRLHWQITRPPNWGLVDFLQLRLGETSYPIGLTPPPTDRTINGTVLTTTYPLLTSDPSPVEACIVITAAADSQPPRCWLMMLD